MSVVDFLDKKKSSLKAADGAGNTDGPHSLGASDSVSLNSAMLMDASFQSSEGQTLENNAENAPATNHVSAEKKQKTSQSPKSRPICMICNKSFLTRYKLNEHHAIVHLDSRLFSCNVCHKMFGRADHLLRHVRNRVCCPQQLPDTSGRTGNPD